MSKDIIQIIHACDINAERQIEVISSHYPASKEVYLVVKGDIIRPVFTEQQYKARIAGLQQQLRKKHRTYVTNYRKLMNKV